MIRNLVAPALAAIACLPVPASADFDRAAFMRLAMSTVRIEALAPDQHYNMGTGVIVGPGRVITSCHVTGPAPSVRVLYGGLRYTVKLQRADVHHDLCMLDVPELEGPVATVGSAANLHLGDAVIAMGFTGGYELQFADGVVRELNREHGQPIIKSSTAFSSGASGGGLFDAAGTLVGILTFRLRGTEDCYYSMPVDHFKAWIASSEGFEAPRLLNQEKPVWMDVPEHQPVFLRVAALEAGHDWLAMQTLASSWLADEPESAYAWLNLGKAALGLHHSDEAEQALQQATRRQPRLAEAWLALARSYAQSHHDPELADARRRLGELDSALAEQLDAQAPGASP
ncbi:MAG: trypsin-like peptidase domain-containing protein [Pseudomonadota bacterium]|nr:trypsin-like peptidase domain-containing protein [Pseudomonadota bacterium]